MELILWVAQLGYGFVCFMIGFWTKSIVSHYHDLRMAGNNFEIPYNILGILFFSGLLIYFIQLQALNPNVDLQLAVVVAPLIGIIGYLVNNESIKHKKKK